MCYIIILYSYYESILFYFLLTKRIHTLKSFLYYETSILILMIACLNLHVYNSENCITFFFLSFLKFCHGIVGNGKSTMLCRSKNKIPLGDVLFPFIFIFLLPFFLFLDTTTSPIGLLLFFSADVFERIFLVFVKR